MKVDPTPLKVVPKVETPSSDKPKVDNVPIKPKEEVPPKAEPVATQPPVVEDLGDSAEEM